jgi:hypothetical protein
MIASFKEADTFEVGDAVRIKMSSLFSDIRRMIKSGNSKYIVVHYSTDIYTVSKATKTATKTNIERFRYQIVNGDDVLLTKRDGTPMIFYSTDLLPLTNEDVQNYNDNINNVMTMDQALALNNSQRNENDVVGV